MIIACCDLPTLIILMNEFGGCFFFLPYFPMQVVQQPPLDIEQIKKEAEKATEEIISKIQMGLEENTGKVVSVAAEIDPSRCRAGRPRPNPNLRITNRCSFRLCG